jgi:hypothetical protein
VVVGVPPSLLVDAMTPLATNPAPLVGTLRPMSASGATIDTDRQVCKAAVCWDDSMNATQRAELRTSSNAATGSAPDTLRSL